MKKIIYFIFLTMLLVGACKEEGLKGFEDSEESVYFYIDEKDGVDDITYSFVYTYEDQVIVNIPVKCSGMAAGKERYFQAVVLADSTTAECEKHYSLPEKAVFPAGEYKASFPVILYNRDKALDSVTFVLAVQLVESSDFVPGDKNRRVAKIRFSNRLEKPEAWQDWMFGEWSRVKHKRLVRIAGRDFPTTDELYADISYWQYGVAIELKNYFIAHYPVTDENNKVIESW